MRMTCAGGKLVYAAGGGSPQWDTCMLQGTIPFYRTPGRFIEQNIGLKTHVQRVMPRFLTLRDAEGNEGWVPADAL